MSCNIKSLVLLAGRQLLKHQFIAQLLIFQLKFIRLASASRSTQLASKMSGIYSRRTQLCIGVV